MHTIFAYSFDVFPPTSVGFGKTDTVDFYEMKLVKFSRSDPPTICMQIGLGLAAKGAKRL